LKISLEKFNILKLIQKEGNVAENIREMRLKAEDITCLSCAGDMENILRNTEGVVDAAVDFADETVYVKYDPQILDRKQVFFAVRKLGYKVKIISEN
jgi:copper chaperone CopZ